MNILVPRFYVPRTNYRRILCILEHPYDTYGQGQGQGLDAYMGVSNMLEGYEIA